jgi:hypothetical protein
MLPYSSARNQVFRAPSGPRVERLSRGPELLRPPADTGNGDRGAEWWPYSIRTSSGRVAERRPPYLWPDPASRTAYEPKPLITSHARRSVAGRALSRTCVRLENSEDELVDLL